jgi:hypothetical protein
MLVHIVDERQFDIVYCRNALDHGLAPMQTWLNMFRTLKVGGYLVQVHSINEAVKQKWKQLHQFNLFPDEENHVMLESEGGDRFCLTRDIALELVLHYKTKWFTSQWRKISNEVGNEFINGANRQLLSALLKRSNWAMHCESLIFEIASLIDPKSAPLDIRVAVDR